MGCSSHLISPSPLIEWLFFCSDSTTHKRKPSLSVLVMLMVWLLASVISIHADCTAVTLDDCGTLKVVMDCGVSTHSPTANGRSSSGDNSALPIETGCFTHLTSLFVSFFVFVVFSFCDQQ